MKSILIAAMGAATLMITSGCSTVIYRVSESLFNPIDIPSVPPETRKAVVCLNATATDADSNRLAASLKMSVESGLVSRGFVVMPDAQSDSTVSLSVTRREKARLDEWRVYEGKVDMSIQHTGRGLLGGSQSFTAIGERSLDETDAEESVKKGLESQISEWLSTAMPLYEVVVPQPTEKSDLTSALITISPANPLEDKGKVLAVQRRFMDFITGLPGVESCRLVKEEPASQSYVFSVEYDQDSFPGGFINTVVLKGGNMSEDVKLEIAR